MISSLGNKRPKPIALIMLEGWGVAPSGDDNYLTNKELYLNNLISHYPVGVLTASGQAVGLAKGQASTSFINQAVIGTGRPYDDLGQLISYQLDDKLLLEKTNFKKLVELINNKNYLHLVGLLSYDDSEASLNHLKKIIIILEKLDLSKIYLHLILDGQNSPKKSGQKLIKDLSHFLINHPACQIVSLVGRIYALDNKFNFERTRQAYQLLTDGIGNVFSSASEAIQNIYDKKIFDKEFTPVIIKDQIGDKITVHHKDVVLFFNYAGQGIRQLTDYFLHNSPELKLISLVDYGLGDKVLPLVDNLFKTESLGKVFSDHNLKQLRISNSAGLANIMAAFDFNTNPFFEGLDKKLIYTSPELGLLDSLLETIKQSRQVFIEMLQKSIYDLMAITLPQLDTLAHTNQRKFLPEIVKNLDDNLRLMIEAVTLAGGLSVIVGTHGFAEKIIDPVTGSEIFSHSLNNVPFYLVGKSLEGYNLGWPEAIGNDLSLLTPLGTLADVAPTILTLAHLPIPKTMMGHSLV